MLAMSRIEAFIKDSILSFDLFKLNQQLIFQKINRLKVQLKLQFFLM